MSDEKSMLSKLKQWYSEFNEDTKTAFRLVEVVKKDNQNYVVIGLRHSHLCFKQPLQEAVLDNNLIEGLSVQDVRILSMYAMFCSLQHRFELIDIEYGHTDKIFFNILDKNSGTAMRLSPSELDECPEIINAFKRDELYKVGYLCGSIAKH